jgi:hypothetical protein
MYVKNKSLFLNYKRYKQTLTMRSTIFYLMYKNDAIKQDYINKSSCDSRELRTRCAHACL